mmetsp:Transcript_57180/g.152680  ORF Transcript_57180/g.152680 Transcript_57180/m.152680 type:complete len:380 (-) Transcript_57180:636-1775(-)
MALLLLRGWCIGTFSSLRKQQKTCLKSSRRHLLHGPAVARAGRGPPFGGTARQGGVAERALARAAAARCVRPGGQRGSAPVQDVRVLRLVAGGRAVRIRPCRQACMRPRWRGLGLPPRALEVVLVANARARVRPRVQWRQRPSPNHLVHFVDARVELHDLRLVPRGGEQPSATRRGCFPPRVLHKVLVVDGKAAQVRPWEELVQGLHYELKFRPLVRVVSPAIRHQRDEVLGELWRELVRHDLWAVPGTEQLGDLARGHVPERNLQAEDLPEQHPEREHIGRGLVVGAARHLGRHPVAGASSPGQFSDGAPSDSHAKIGHLHEGFAICRDHGLVQQTIERFQVPVDDRGLEAMEVIHGICDVAGDLQLLFPMDFIRGIV